MASHESRDPEETMCEIWRLQVEYFARKSICQKVNLSVNQERTAGPDITNLITRFFLRKTRLKSTLRIWVWQARPRCYRWEDSWICTCSLETNVSRNTKVTSSKTGQVVQLPRLILLHFERNCKAFLRLRRWMWKWSGQQVIYVPLWPCYCNYLWWKAPNYLGAKFNCLPWTEATIKAASWLSWPWKS